MEMMCAGCVGAVKRILGKMDGTSAPYICYLSCHPAVLAVTGTLRTAGVSSFDVNLEERKVTIQGDVTPEQVCARALQ